MCQTGSAGKTTGYESHKCNMRGSSQLDNETKTVESDQSN